MTGLNWCGISTETIAAEYETDAALAECGYPPRGNPSRWPPDGDYFWSAWSAEQALRDRDNRMKELDV